VVLCGFERFWINSVITSYEVCMDWKVCDWMLSPPIWCNMWIRTDDRGWCAWPNLRWYVDRILWCRMLYWLKIKWFVDWKWCYRKPSRPIWSTMWISSDDRRWCHDLIWGDMWIGTYDIRCCHEKYECYADWIGRYRKHSRPIWSKCELEQMILDDVMT
jgi:hypothetical protein